MRLKERKDGKDFRKKLVSLIRPAKRWILGAFRNLMDNL